MHYTVRTLYCSHFLAFDKLIISICKFNSIASSAAQMARAGEEEQNPLCIKSVITVQLSQSNRIPRKQILEW